MRRTRRGSERQNVNKWTNFLIFFVLAPIVAILLTIGLFKYLILPQFLPEDDKDANNNQIEQETDNPNSTDENDNSNSNEENNGQLSMYTLDGMDLFSVQIGSFGSKENAEKLVEQLKENGLDGYLIEKDSYKVFAGTFFSRQEADVYLIKVREYYSDAFIKSFSINGTTVQYFTKDQEHMNTLGVIVSSLNQFFADESILWTNALNNNNAQSVKGTMVSNNNTVKNLLSGVKSNVNSEELKDLIEKIDNNLEERQYIIDSLITNDIQSIKNAYTKFSTTLFEYMKIITSQS